jgi:zinc/manganese transport system permease protein
MESLWNIFIAPFAEYAFMQKALLSCVLLCISAVPLGVFLLLRGLSLVGDSLSHGILPGIALAAIFFGLNPIALFIGGITAGLIVAFVSNQLGRRSIIPEDASFTVIYSFSLALGVLILFRHGTNTNVLHLLFGSVLGIDIVTLGLIALVCVITTIYLSMYRKLLLMYCFDPLLFQVAGKPHRLLMIGFLALVVANLVASYQAIGTLLALGLMMLPAITARLLCTHYRQIFKLSSILGIFGCYAGLLLSYHIDWPSGPAIILCLGTQCLIVYGLMIKKNTH